MCNIKKVCKNSVKSRNLSPKIARSRSIGERRKLRSTPTTYQITSAHQRGVEEETYIKELQSEAAKEETGNCAIKLKILLD